MNKKRATIIFDEDVSGKNYDENKVAPKIVDSITFDTILRIDNHLKNFMKARVILGDVTTQKKALKNNKHHILKVLLMMNVKHLKCR